MTKLLGGAWRTEFEQLLRGTADSLMIATPYIKLDEAQRVSEILAGTAVHPETRVRVLTDFRADSIVASSLDVGALRHLAVSFRRCEVISVPRLHAKVYVSDERVAIVTSGNLTRPGLESNIEYGIQLEEGSLVRKILDDMSAYARLGSEVPGAVLDELVPVEQELRSDFARVLRSARGDVRRRFEERYRSASEALIATQVGTRSANVVFSGAILHVLSERPATTAELQPHIQRLLPDLCDDSIELIINGERYGKRWKHQVRNAQQSLKRAGHISFDGIRWVRGNTP